jgi:hypothetical protein
MIECNNGQIDANASTSYIPKPFHRKLPCMCEHGWECEGGSDRNRYNKIAYIRRTSTTHTKEGGV